MKWLICVDGSPSSKKAIQSVSKQAKKDDSLILLNVTPPVEMSGSTGKESFSLYKHISDSNQVLDEYIYELQQAGFTKMEKVIVPGEPREIILEKAEKLNVDIIAMGHVGLSRLKGVLVGSVANNTIAQANLPVLVVKDS